MCGILATILASRSGDVAPELHQALSFLQHRGQDACGITTCSSKGRFHTTKGNGLAARVFNDASTVENLSGYMGVGHLRYPTAGTLASSEAQPFYVNSPYGIAFTHNGNLINSPELLEYLDQVAHRHINTDSDSELMLNIFADELNETGKARVNASDCFDALERMGKKCKGAWACTAMLAGFGLIGFRDPYGIRPMSIGERPSEDVPGGKDYMMASESNALYKNGYRNIRDILPGQAVIIERGQAPQFRQVCEQQAYAPDIFEFVYFARPESSIDGISVAMARKYMGARLAEKIQKQLGTELLKQFDCVMGIPDTGNLAAQEVCRKIKKPLEFGFQKNTYIFRTFLMPTQAARQSSVRRKLTTIPHLFEGKNVLLVDDSIVRGTTSREIVQMARDAGAKKVVFCSCAPPITNHHIYGIDLASKSELIAHQRTTKDIADHLGADDVVYQDLDDLVSACAQDSPRKNQQFEVGVFTGSYVTPVNENYFDHLEALRGKPPLNGTKNVDIATNGGDASDHGKVNGK